MANVCQTCGDRGFEEALLYCESCKIEVVHRYCMGVTPVPFTQYITWICEDCDGSECDSNSIELDQTAKPRLILKESDKNEEKEAEEVEEEEEKEEEEQEEEEEEHEPHIPNSIEFDQTEKPRLILKKSDKNKEKEEEEQEEEEEEEQDPHIPSFSD